MAAPLTVKSFVGSITDDYIGADPTSFERADNFVVDEYEKLVSRPGRELDFADDTTRAKVVPSNGSRRINLMCEQVVGADRKFTALKIVGETIQYDDLTTMAELLGPDSESAFVMTPAVDAKTGFAYAKWNNHTYICHDQLQKPVTVYCDDTGALQLRTTGLPILPNTFTATGGSGGNYLYALVLKYEYKVGDITYIERSAPIIKEFTNIGNTNPASSPAITVGSIPVLANANASEHYDVAEIDVEIYRTSNEGNVFYLVNSIDNSTTSYNDTMSDNTLRTQEILYTEGGVIENDRPPKCKFIHGTSDFVYYAAGIEVSPIGADIGFQPQRVWQSKRGAPGAVPASFYADVDEPITGISSVGSIPIVFCENSIYRLDGYFDNLGRNGILTKKIADSVGSVNHLSLIQTLEGIFFAGNDGFYFTDGYRIYPLSDSFRKTYAKLIDTPLKRKRIYGELDLNNQYVLWATWRSFNESYDDDCSQIFCLDLRKKTFTTWSSGFSGDISKEIEGDNTDSAITVSDNTGIIPGMYVFRDDELSPLTPGTLVRDLASTTIVNLSHDANDETDLNYKFISGSPENCFYRNFLPTALLFADKKMFMGDRHGFTTWFNSEKPNDVWIDPSAALDPDDFESLPIWYSYASPAFDFGTTEARKYVHTILTKARPRLDINAEMTLQITGVNDDNGSPHPLTYIFFERFYLWGTPQIVYGDPRLWRAARTIIDVKRRFPAGKLRCEYKQIGMTPAFANIYQSSVYAECSIEAEPDPNIYKCTILDGIWPTDTIGYYLSLAQDEYVFNYRIFKYVSPTEILILDPNGTLGNHVSVEWNIRGLKKQALINLIEYSIFHEVIGPSQLPYQGENAVRQ